MSNAIIRVENGEKYYNRRKPNELHVIDNLNIALPSSGLIAVFGKSGCGKTTMLNVIGGLDKLGSGTVEIFGQDLSRHTDEIRNRYIGYVFQNYNLNNDETVFENVADALLLCGVTDKEEIKSRVMASLSNVGMEKFRDRQPDTLSGGQQQRVAIARALAKNPPILLADEPTGNLDETNTVMVMDILKEVSKQHLVLLVTHEANLVDFYCDRVIEIVDGSIRNIRDNDNADGYVARNKNDIYLGELQKQEVSAPGVQIEYYGEPTQEIQLQIVSVDGKLYLKSNTPTLRVLDSSSEIHLKEGSFEGEKQLAERSETVSAMKDLPPMCEGKHYGRLYHWKNALSAAWRENFSSKTKKKKGKGLLRVVLTLLSIVLVFLSATFGVNFKNYFEVKEAINENIFYLPADVTRDYSALYDSMGKNGIDYAYFVDSYQGSETEVIFSGGDFMTSASGTVSANGMMLTSEQIGSEKVLAGSATISTLGDMVITSAMADKMIESSAFSYIDSYDSLIGLLSTQVGNFNDRVFRIVGVVENSQRCFYVDPILAAKQVLGEIDYSGSIAAFSMQSAIGESPLPGNAVVVNNSYYSKYWDGNDHKIGEKIEILGRTFTVSKVFTIYTEPSNYADYVLERYGITLLSLDEYLVSELPDPSFNDDQKTYEWFFNYYPHYLQEYAQEIGKNTGYYWDYSVYAIAKSNDPFEYMYSYGEWTVFENDFDFGELYEAYNAYKKNGSWPASVTVTEISEYNFYETVENSRDWTAYDVAYSLLSATSAPSFSCLLNDADYQSLIYSIGQFNGYNPFYSYEDDDETKYGYEILIHSTDAEATATFLADSFGGFEITPEEKLAQTISSSKGVIVGSLIAMLAVLASLCLCVFFIMRSSFMSHVKEVGIQRAIGVSKPNLLFKFGVEAFLLTSLTVLVGFVLSAYVLSFLSTAALFNAIFYFPRWLAGILLCTLYLFSLFFGILPALLLLRKTPSEILSKYDI